MGHLIPFFHLAADLHSRGAAATIIIVEPTVSASESDYLSNFSAAVIDLPVLSRVLHLASLPIYTSITTSARFFSLMASLSHLPPHNNGRLKIPNLGSIPISSIPPPMLDPNHYFVVTITTNTATLERRRRSVADFVVEP